jgi:ribosomal protein L40E
VDLSGDGDGELTASGLICGSCGAQPSASAKFCAECRDIMVLRLRTLLAKARNDDTAYRDLRKRYRAMANSFGYEGHIAWAEAMP